MKTYDELLAERDALACQLSDIQAAVKMLRQSKAGVKRTVAWMALNGATKPTPHQRLVDVKAEAVHDFVTFLPTYAYDINIRLRNEAIKYEAKIRKGGE